MRHCEKFIYCEREKDTKKFLKILEKYNIANRGYEIVEITTLKKNWIARYRKTLGIQFGDFKMPFNFPSILEIENSEEFYRENDKLPYEIEEKLNEIEIRPYYGKEEEHFFNKNETLIWISGNRGNMSDVYSMLGLDSNAVQAMLSMKKDGVFPEDGMVDGKIDIVKVQSTFQRVMARLFLEEEEVKILEEVKFIDIDGIPDVDAKLKDTSLFRYKRYGAV